MKKILALCLVLAAITLFPCPSARADGAFHKLGRGFINTLTGWMEIFYTANLKFREHDNDVFQGLAAIPEGVVRAVIRTSVGIYETVTFPLPIPENYTAIVEPEFLFVKTNPYENVYTNDEGPYN